MKRTTHLKYIEWRDAEGLHEDTQVSLSELKFLKDELQFLKNLVAEHTLELIYGKSSEISKAIFSQLKEHSKRVEILLKELVAHDNNLQIVLDDNDIPGEMGVYKENHHRLILEEMDFHSNVKHTKQSIFKMLADIMKKSKQRKLS